MPPRPTLLPRTAPRTDTAAAVRLRRTPDRAVRRVLLAMGLLAAVLATGCDGFSGDPAAESPVGTTSVCTGGPLASGPHLYCVTNVGRTVRALELQTGALAPASCRLPDYDPVGPWFHGGRGFYLSRVEGGGAGANALVGFDPRTLAPTGARLGFPPGSNPNSLLMLPSSPAWPDGLAWVALRGSTFDNFRHNGIAVVDLATLRDVAYCDLNAAVGTCPRLGPDGAGTLTSLLGAVWDPTGCGGTGCAYAVVNNWDGAVREGRLLVLQPDPQGRPMLVDDVVLGVNPQLELARAASGELWVVNNGGFVAFCATAGCAGRPGTLQVLDTAALGDGTPGNGTLRWLAAPGTCPTADQGAPCTEVPGFPSDPTGLHAVASGTAWLTTYPNDTLLALDLAAGELDTTPLPARATGPLYSTTGVAGLFGGRNGFGTARLGAFNPTTGALLQDHELAAGGGPLTCGEYDLP